MHRQEDALSARLKRIGAMFTLLGALAVPLGTYYWSINSVNDTPVVQAA